MKNIFISSTINYLFLFCSIFNLVLDRSLFQAIAEKPPLKVASISSSRNISNSNSEQNVKKPKFPNQGVPTGRRRGGTSRSECPATNSSLTAIVPGIETKETNLTTSDRNLSEFATQTTFTDSKSFLTRTLKEYPTFWVYIPEPINSSRKGEFILQDDEDNDIYRTYLNLPNKSGIINIDLPNQPQNSLKIGQKYHWYVKIFCGEPNEEATYSNQESDVRKYR